VKCLCLVNIFLLTVLLLNKVDKLIPILFQSVLISYISACSIAVAWFTFDPVLSGGAGSGLIFSKNNATVSVEGWEHRVALGSVGFSRGVHYWEFTIDNYTADTDPAFGVARIDVARRA